MYTRRQGQEEGRGLTREARLADLAAPPVVVVALPAQPVPRLLLRRALVARVDDRRELSCVRRQKRLWRRARHTYCHESGVDWADLARLGGRFVIRPVHDARRQRVARDVANAATDTERTSRRRERRVLWRWGLRMQLSVHRRVRPCAGWAVEVEVRRRSRRRQSREWRLRRALDTVVTRRESGRGVRKRVVRRVHDVDRERRRAARARTSTDDA